MFLCVCPRREGRDQREEAGGPPRSREKRQGPAAPLVEREKRDSFFFWWVFVGRNVPKCAKCSAC